MAHSEPVERHKIGRLGWLRAMVLGANDGILSTSSLLVGVIASNPSRNIVLVTGISGLIAGAMSMGAGEYVSVSSQSDSESAELHLEQQELLQDWDAEVNELTRIYMNRGLEKPLAREVATRLMEHNALEAHARDELNISELTAAKPFQAAIASALSFSLGGIVPVLVVLLVPLSMLHWVLSITSLIELAVLGVVGAKAGNAKPLRASLRVVCWGAATMAATSFIGKLFNAPIMD
ncbi:ferrous iron transporter Pcl1 [Schizosaccharomyces japonicus yFS275]|uniref:Ferrous iron transporter Pcl1 n=1 Tax=Schizosaccharomyces japonicus (strain yFS275 / FY16936) TaxID=402676 RepID=B6K7Z4_SCHJY|nr:ferrous iron transporter Pcl1 [Schizosaccharomyces japonicus yFS275]EEB09648.1 ferrous iron transporter Pcl1 [Schizosaccharomyces japonicus yFS275]